jgi:hypothetical protein
MKLIQMNDNDKFDVDLSQLEVKINTKDLFTSIEEPSVNSVNKFISSKHELKNSFKSTKTNNYFIEYGIMVKGEFKKSGISTSEADLQTYTIGEIIHSYPTKFIKWASDNRKKLDLKESQVNADDYVGFGILIPIYRIFDLYYYYHKETRLKALNRK